MGKSPAALAFRLSLPLCLLGLSALVWTEALLYSQNTLYNNERWLVSEGGDLSRRELVMNRAFLAGDSLNLDIHNGHEEFETREQARPTAISFDFLVHEGAFLDFYFGRSRAGPRGSQLGLRFSRYRNLPSLFFRGDLRGEFSSSQPLGMPELSRGWHKAAIVERGNELLLTLDGGAPLPIAHERFPAGAIAFRSSFFGARVGGVDIDYENGASLHERFRNRAHWARALAVTLLGLFAVIFVLALVRATYRKRRGEIAAPLSFVRRLAWISLSASLLWFAFDFFDVSERTPLLFRPVVDFRAKEAAWRSPAEQVRSRVFGFWYFLAGGRAIDLGDTDKWIVPGKTPRWTGFAVCGGREPDCRFANTEEELKAWIGMPKRNPRLLLLGGSIFEGFGARAFQETLFVRLFEMIRGEGRFASIEAINLSKPGTGVEAFLPLNVAESFAPDLVVVNSVYSGLLDDGGKSERMREWVKALTLRGTKVVFLDFCLDPGFFSFVEQNLINGQASTRLLAFWVESGLASIVGPAGAQVISCSEFLYDPQLLSTGYVWAQTYHLSSHGQDQLARWLAPKLIAALRAGGGERRAPR